ncbi:MAG: hypothetical protein ABI164_07450, partial [Acidobacteriaceae bacterium]
RQLYYSGVDKRYHLRDASEMWIEVGHVVGDEKDLEIRAYDTNHDGFLDTWEVFQAGQATPVRVTRVLDPQARIVPLDRRSMRSEYNAHILPNAIAEDQQLISEMKKLVSSALAAKYEDAAAQSQMPESRRYCLDIARELYFLKTRDELYTRNSAGDYPALSEAAPQRIVTAGPVDNRYTIKDTLRYWTLAGQIEQFVDAYGSGHYVEAQEILKVINTAKPD